jgi:phosphoadenosine phosphosulfate reductase
LLKEIFTCNKLMMNAIDRITHALTGLDAATGLSRICQEFKEVRFATSLGEEDQVITHLIASRKLPIKIFTLDTGRLFPETYDLIELTQQALSVPITVFYPEGTEVEAYVNTKGINAFYHSVDNRKQCCHIRKVLPLKRALEGAEVWITGLRGSQSANRQKMERVEWSEEMNVVKYNPLFDWTDEALQDYLAIYKVPVNPLHKKGFASIGCAPCTRAILPGEDARAGRWWWEATAKECGLHTTKV